MSDETEKSAETPVADTAAVEKEADASQVETTEGKDETKPDGEAEAKPDGEEGEKRKREPGSVREKRRAEMLRAENAELTRKLEEAERKASKDAGEGEQPPKEEDFNGDWTAYIAARAAFEAGKAVEKKLTEREVRERESSQVDVNRERKLAHLDRVDEAKEVITDFEKVMDGMKGVTVRDEVIDEIIASDKSALLSYHLAKNPDTLRALNNMTGRELAREIGRLEGSIRMPSGKKQTTAPPPPSQVSGGAAPGFDASKASMSEYAAEYARRQKAEEAR